MQSPLPGMDPYLESPAYWFDFHSRFITYWSDALSDVLPDRYEARIDERVELVQVSPQDLKRVRPDVAVTRAQRGTETPASSSANSVATLEPVAIPQVVQEET